MGVLNVTPDSFSDGGQYQNVSDAIHHAQKLVAEGADLIDVGGESTRPGSRGTDAAEEIQRVVPVIRELVARLAVPISVDTSKPEVMTAAVAAGAGLFTWALPGVGSVWRLTVEDSSGQTAFRTFALSSRPTTGADGPTQAVAAPSGADGPKLTVDRQVYADFVDLLIRHPNLNGRLRIFADEGIQRRGQQGFDLPAHALKLVRSLVRLHLHLRRHQLRRGHQEGNH